MLSSFSANMTPVSAGGKSTSTTADQEWKWQNQLEIGSRRRMLMMAIARTQGAEKSKLFQLLSKSETETKPVPTSNKIRSTIESISRPFENAEVSVGNDGSTHSQRLGCPSDEGSSTTSSVGTLKNTSSESYSNRVHLHHSDIDAAKSMPHTTRNSSKDFQGMTERQDYKEVRSPSLNSLARRENAPNAHIALRQKRLQSLAVNKGSASSWTRTSADRTTSSSRKSTGRVLLKSPLYDDAAPIPGSPKMRRRLPLRRPTFENDDLTEEKEQSTTPSTSSTTTDSTSNCHQETRQEDHYPSIDVATSPAMSPSPRRAEVQNFFENLLAKDPSYDDIPSDEEGFIDSPEYDDGHDDRDSALCPSMEEDEGDVTFPIPPLTPHIPRKITERTMVSPRDCQIQEALRTRNSKTYPNNSDLYTGKKKSTGFKKGLSINTLLPTSAIPSPPGTLDILNRDSNDTTTVSTTPDSRSATKLERKSSKISLDSDVKASTTFFGKLVSPTKGDKVVDFKMRSYEDHHAILKSYQKYQELRSVSPQQPSNHRKVEKSQKSKYLQPKTTVGDKKYSNMASAEANDKNMPDRTDMRERLTDENADAVLDEILSMGSKEERSSSISLQKSSSDSIVASFEELINDLSKIVDDDEQIAAAEEVLSEVRRTTKDAKASDADLEEALERMQSAVEKIKCLSGLRQDTLDSEDQENERVTSSRTPLHANNGKVFNFKEKEIEQDVDEADSGSTSQFEQENLSQPVEKIKALLEKLEDINLTIEQKMTPPETDCPSNCKPSDESVQQKLGNLLDGKKMFANVDVGVKAGLSPAKDISNSRTNESTSKPPETNVTRIVPTPTNRLKVAMIDASKKSIRNSVLSEDSESTESEDDSSDDSSISSASSHAVPREVICENEPNSIIERSTFSIGSTSVVSSNPYGSDNKWGRKVGGTEPATNSSLARGNELALADQKSNKLWSKNLSDVLKNPTLLCRCTGPIVLSPRSVEDEDVLKERLTVEDNGRIKFTA